MMGVTTDRLCRKYHQYPETVEHILSGCPELAQRQYLWRHNDTLKWVLSELLIAHKFIEKQLPLKQEPHSNYNNADVEILWYCTVSRDGPPAESSILGMKLSPVCVFPLSSPVFRHSNKVPSSILILPSRILIKFLVISFHMLITVFLHTNKMRSSILILSSRILITVFLHTNKVSSRFFSYVKNCLHPFVFSILSALIGFYKDPLLESIKAHKM